MKKSFPFGMEATREIHLHVVISRSPAGRHPQLRFGCSVVPGAYRHTGRQ
jgi:hypothetical protein